MPGSARPGPHGCDGPMGKGRGGGGGGQYIAPLARPYRYRTGAGTGARDCCSPLELESLKVLGPFQILCGYPDKPQFCKDATSISPQINALSKIHGLPARPPPASPQTVNLEWPVVADGVSSRHSSPLSHIAPRERSASGPRPRTTTVGMVPARLPKYAFLPCFFLNAERIVWPPDAERNRACAYLAFFLTAPFACLPLDINSRRCSRLVAFDLDGAQQASPRPAAQPQSRSVSP